MELAIIMRTLNFVAGIVWTVFAFPSTAAPPEPISPSAESDLLRNPRQLLFEGLRSGEGYFSADGKTMIFQSERDPGNPFYQMYLMDLETGDTVRVSPGTGKTTCGWIHPSGAKVSFASTHEDPAAVAKQREELDKRAQGQGSRYAWSFDEHYDIYEADTSGNILRNLTRTPGYDAEGAWSPAGERLVFASNRHAYTDELSPEERQQLDRDPSYFMEIYTMDAQGGDVRRLTHAPGYDGGPFFSPDGERIVWRRFDESGHVAEVWTMRTDGTDPRQITHLGAMSWAPFYHPSGEYIVFATNLHGYDDFELYLVDVAGAHAPVRVTHTPGFDGLPVFTPDGARLAWVTKRAADESAQIFMADWDHERARRLLGLDARSAAEPVTPTDMLPPPMPDLAATEAAIGPDDIRQHVGYLADPALGGRLTGSPGERLATDYVARIFAALGLEPAGDAGWFQSFDFTAGVSLGPDNGLVISSPAGSVPLRPDTDWRPLAFSPNGEVAPAGMVFAGYGIVAPATESFAAYDAYGDLDVTDRWVMVLRYMPEDIAAEQRQHLMHYAELRYKAMVARDKGARGLIVVSGPNSAVKHQLIAMSREAAAAGGGFPVISVTDAVADRLVDPLDTALQTLQSALDTGAAEPGFAIPDIALGARIDIQKEARQGRNVLGILRVADEPTAELVVVGAHVDHIGTGEGLDSLAAGDDAGQVHPGADDNASGVGGLLEIAQYLADLQRRGTLGARRDILFAAWSGEELGILGSNHFVATFDGVEQTGSLRPKVAAYLNLDMIGRLDSKLYLQGIGSSQSWAGEIERRNAPIGLSIVTQQDSYLPTDATPFYLKGVPVLNAFSGAHRDYNTPRDTADTLNYEGAARIARFMALMTRALAKAEAPPDYVAMEKPAATASRRNLRAYLGTIPEYADTGLKGVKLNGVAAGSPAALGGLASGDVIVRLAGKAIENIYDFTYALNACKVGQAVDVVVVRAGARHTLTVIPASRE
jgi:Tol biopolymer transport system component